MGDTSAVGRQNGADAVASDIPRERAATICGAWLDSEHPNVTTLCREFGISRKTGYKWIARFKEGGVTALYDQSRRFRHHPKETPEKVVELVIGTRRQHPTWGPKKIQAWLRGRGWPAPAGSTIGKILQREGLVRKRRRRERAGAFTTGLTPQEKPYAVWGADFKGWFKLETGTRCYPLTISDGFSRYLLRC